MNSPHENKEKPSSVSDFLLFEASHLSEFFLASFLACKVTVLLLLLIFSNDTPMVVLRI